MTDTKGRRDRLRLEPMSLPNVLPFSKASARIGELLLPLFRQRAAALKAGKLSLHPTRLEDLLIAGLVRRHLRRGTLDELIAMHDWFWSNSPAVRFHEFAETRFETFFLQHHVAIVPPLRAALSDERGSYHALCEIGCGSGRVLEHLATALNEIPRFIGLDLSPEQIARNRVRYAGHPIEFEAADGAAWVATHAKPGWVFLTYGGVLEYFSRQKVFTLFSTISAALAPALLVLVEPLSDEQPLGGAGDSTPFGTENTFSHDYVGLLHATQFAILFRTEQRFDNQRWLLLVARTHAPAATDARFPHRVLEGVSGQQG
jgi:SAM-dependent methyltransferase